MSDDRPTNQSGPVPAVSFGETDSRVTFVCDEIRRWRREGAIGARQAARLLSDYEAVPTSASALPLDDQWPRVSVPLTASMVLLYIGGLLIVVAAIMLLSNVWKDLGVGGRFALVALPTAGLYGAGAYLWATSARQRVPAAVMLFFACLLIPVTFWFGSVCLVGEHPAQGGQRLQALTVAVLTLAAHLGTLYGFRSPLLTIPYPASFLWVAMQSAYVAVAGQPSFDEISKYVGLLCGLILVTAGIHCASLGKPTYAAMPDLTGTVLALGALVALGAEGKHAGWEICAVLTSLGAIAASVYRRNQTYLFVGALFLVVNIFRIGFEYFKDTAGLPLTLLGCGCLSMAMGYGVHRVRKEYVVDEPE